MLGVDFFPNDVLKLMNLIPIDIQPKSFKIIHNAMVYFVQEKGISFRSLPPMTMKGNYEKYLESLVFIRHPNIHQFSIMLDYLILPTILSLEKLGLVADLRDQFSEYYQDVSNYYNKNPYFIYDPKIDEKFADDFSTKIFTSSHKIDKPIDEFNQLIHKTWVEKWYSKYGKDFSKMNYLMTLKELSSIQDNAFQGKFEDVMTILKNVPNYNYRSAQYLHDHIKYNDDLLTPTNAYGNKREFEQILKSFMSVAHIEKYQKMHFR